MSSASPQQLTVASKKVICPHCWSSFAPEDSLWIAEHPEIVGDAKLGPDAPRRFLPSRLTVEGDALDEAGYRTSRLACPACHLEVPRAFYQIQPIFFSILGAPACGKSYFLASMTWKMRQMLPSQFAVSMNDADALANARLHEYEELQFLNPDPDELVRDPKDRSSRPVIRFGQHGRSLGAIATPVHVYDAAVIETLAVSERKTHLACTVPV